MGEPHQLADEFNDSGPHGVLGFLAALQQFDRKVRKRADTRGSHKNLSRIRPRAGEEGHGLSSRSQRSSV